jgi:protein-disulfide isomerase
VRIVLKWLRYVAVTVWLAACACRAQVSTPIVATPSSPSVQVGVKLSPEIARRVEIMIRNKSQVPQDYRISIGGPTASSTQDFDQIVVEVGQSDKAGVPIPFLISTDGKTLAQLNKFDISLDPREAVPSAGRPARGGDENAPVLIVGFDDLECPFCAKMNALLFPAVLDRYKKQVRIVYRDFPLSEIHPWAMHAAVDANCLGVASTDAYWRFVDYVHAHADEMGGPEQTVARAVQELDNLTLEEGVGSKLNAKALEACVEKQDTTKVQVSVKEAEASPLNVDSTPMLFINGEKVDGILPLESLYRIIDRALIASGQPLPQPPSSEAPRVPIAGPPPR